MVACPDEVWGDRIEPSAFWYLAFHTLFFLDLYLTGTTEGFAPPAPFTLGELDPAGVMPERVYTKAELLAYLAHGRDKCRAVLAAMTDARACERCAFAWRVLGFAELQLYSLRHVQHHAAQLNLLLRQRTDSAPRWVGTASVPLEG